MMMMSMLGCAACSSDGASKEGSGLSDAINEWLNGLGYK